MEKQRAKKRPLYIAGAYDADSSRLLPVMTASGWSEVDARALLRARLQDEHLDPDKLEIQVSIL